MQMPVNTFKRALQRGEPQIGFWVGLADSYVAELLAGTGFDWLLIDTEHAPNDPRSVLRQLQAIAAYPVHPIVRPVHGSVELIKQYLDLGVQTLIIPMVETAEQAAAMVAATRYPPAGIRGVGSSLARASRWSSVPDYLYTAETDICLIVQVESVNALRNLDAIAAVQGVDAVFVGPSDLAASMGHLGNPTHPEVQRAIEDAVGRILKAGKPPGILALDQPTAKRYMEMGCRFVAVGVDAMLLSSAARDLAQSFRQPAREYPGASPQALV